MLPVSFCMLRNAPYCPAVMEVDGESMHLQHFPPALYSPSALSEGGGEYFMNSNQTSPPNPVSQQLLNYGSESYGSDPNLAFPAIGAAQPLNLTMPGAMYDEPIDSLEMLLNGEPLSDLGPPPMPVAAPRMEVEPPTKQEAQSAYAPLHFESRSSPNSPGDTRRRTVHGGPLDGRGAGGRIRNRMNGLVKSSRHNYLLRMARATSPIFPEQSTPLCTVSKHSSSSVSIASTKSDPFGTISSRHSAISDPGLYAMQNSQFVLDSPAMSHLTSPAMSSHNSPSISSVQDDVDSPKFNFGQIQPFQVMQSSTRSNMEMEMSMKHARRIMEMDKRILKLQAERAKYLSEKIPKLDGTTVPQEDKWSERWSLTERPQETCKVHLYVYQLGIHALDEPFFEEAHSLLRQIGGLHQDLQTSIASLRHICCKGMSNTPDMSTCFAYIKSLLYRNQQLKLISSIQSIYRIELDSQSAEGKLLLVPPEFEEALSAANHVLKCAQHITLSFTDIDKRLKCIQQMVIEKVNSSDDICQNVGIMDRERRSHVRSVMEGNNTTISLALKVWSQYYQTATDTIKSITECIHPTSM